jgi:hypothetical protein
MDLFKSLLYLSTAVLTTIGFSVAILWTETKREKENIKEMDDLEESEHGIVIDSSFRSKEFHKLDKEEKKEYAERAFTKMFCETNKESTRRWSR